MISLSPLMRHVKSDVAAGAKRLRLAPLVAAILLSGCSFIPAYERPPAPVAGDFPTAPGARAGASAFSQPASDIAWQDYFADPRLRELIGIALANNRDLRVAVLNIEQARAQYGLRRADRFPTLNAGLNASRGTITAPSSAVPRGSLIDTYSAGLSITSYELDFFGRVASLNEVALAQYLATAEGRKTAQISLVSSVANAWLSLLADEELMKLARQTVSTREESVKLTKLRLDNGVASGLDFSQAQSLAEQAKSALAQARQRRALDENALVLLLGQPLPDDARNSLAKSTLASAGVLADIPAGLPSDLLIERPDIRQAELQLQAANANIGAARAAFFPRISLTASLGVASTQLSSLFEAGSKAWSIAPSLVLPIFDAGRNQSNLDIARVGRDIAVVQYEKSIQTAFREVADALANRQTLVEQLRAQQAQATAESERFKLSDLRYRNGVATYLDLLDAQRSLFAVQQQVVQTRLAQLQNQITVYKVLGGGWRTAGDAPAPSATPSSGAADSVTSPGSGAPPPAPALPAVPGKPAR
jgi:multidrug efflux system outer membrane protein